MAQSLRIDILDSSGTKVGRGPVTSATSASVTRSLDGAGSIQLVLPGTEDRAVDLVTNERRAEIYLTDDSQTPRALGSGVLRQIGVDASGSGWNLTASGPDRLDELRRFSTLLRREYRAQTAQTIIEDLASLAGWTASVESSIASNLLTARFDGESVLKALQAIVENYGYHLRQVGISKSFEVGLFGASSGIVALNARQAPPAVYRNSNIVLIDSISVTRDSEHLVNWIMPLGGGTGLAALTLEHSTRTSPYTIQSFTGPDGTQQYYLEDTASIAEFGLSQQTGTFKDITPLDNTESGIILASNALYDAAAAYLQRSSQRLDTYSLSVSKVDQTIRPGDKIRIVYRGLVYDKQGKPVDFLNVDTEVWVLKAMESINSISQTMSLTVATVDRHAYDTAKIIVGAIEAIKLANLKIQPYPTTSSFVYLRQIDSTHSAVIPVELTNGILYLDRCRLRVTTRPFRATAKGASNAAAVVGSTATSSAVVGSTASGGSSTPTSSSGGSSSPTTSSGGSSTPTSAGGGDHRHRVAVYVTGSLAGGAKDYLMASDSGGTGTYRVNFGGPAFDLWTFDGSGDHSHSITIPSHSHTVTIPAHTHDISIPAHTHDVTLPSHAHDVTIPAHSHDLLYGITDDVSTPDTISIAINGVDRTTELGGPWAVGGGNLDLVLDIAQYLQSAVTLRQKHEVELTCTSGQGEVEALVELKATVQSLQQV